MLHYNPEKRLTIAEIRLHPWMQGEHASSEEISNELAVRLMRKFGEVSERAEEAKGTPFKAAVVRGSEEVEEVKERPAKEPCPFEFIPDKTT
jgi:hypothetical protein